MTTEDVAAAIEVAVKHAIACDMSAPEFLDLVVDVVCEHTVNKQSWGITKEEGDK